MAKVLVLYYSAYGHIEKMAYAVAEGAKSAGVRLRPAYPRYQAFPTDEGNTHADDRCLRRLWNVRRLGRLA